MKTQCEIVLETFQSAPFKTLTTAQIDKIPYMTNQRARVSDLRKLGHVFHVERIKGKHQSKFTYLGQHNIMADNSTKQWYPLPNSFEVFL